MACFVIENLDFSKNLPLLQNKMTYMASLRLARGHLKNIAQILD